MARVVCAIILLLELRGLSLSIPDRKWMALVFYTQLSNLITTVSALLLLIFGQRQWVTTLRYISSCMLVMTFFVTTCVLIPMGGDPKKLLRSENGLYHHVLCPAISTFSYIFLEQHSGEIWLPVIITLAYGLTMLWLNRIRKVDGPYLFFRVHNQTAAMTVLWITALMLVMTGISAGICAVAR